MKLPVYQLPSLSGDQLPFLNTIFSRIIHAVNNLEFGTLEKGGENVWCSFVIIENADADACASASHGLKRVPAGTISIWQDSPGSLYKPTDETSADTEDAVFFLFDSAVTCAVLLLI